MIKHDSDQLEKERRSRNIVVSGVKESNKPNIDDKITEDKAFLTDVLEIQSSKIVKCSRAGPPLGTGSNKERTAPRPLIVVLESPQLASKYHEFGNGNRILHDNDVYWINPDYTKSERIANWRARQARKNRQQKIFEKVEN